MSSPDRARQPPTMSSSDGARQPAPTSGTDGARPPAAVGAGAELMRGTAVNALAILAANFRGVFTFLIARLLGKVALGTFSVAWTIADIVSQVSTFGLDDGTTALVARRQAAGDAAGSYRVFAGAAAWGVGISVALAAGGIVVLWLGGGALPLAGPVVEAAGIMLLALPALALYRIANGASRGMKVMRHSIWSKGVAENGATLAAFLTLVAVGARQVAAPLAVVAGTACGAVVALWLARRLFAERRAARPGEAGEPSARGTLSFSAPIGGYRVLNMIVWRMDLLLLGAWVGGAPGVTLASVGVYAAAIEVAGGATKVRHVITPALMPLVAGLATHRDEASLHRVFADAGRWVLAAVLGLFGAVLLAGGAVLSIFGPDFRDGVVWLWVLVAAYGINSLSSLAETVITVERPATNLINSAVAAAVQLGLIVVLLPAYGPLGAALGTLGAYVVLSTLRYAELAVAYRWTWHPGAYVRPVVAFAAAMLPAAGLRWAWSGGGWPAELAAAALFLAVYVGAWKLIGLDASDRAILAEIRRSSMK